MNRLDLAGRRAVVTGAAAGLGLAIAKRLAQSGARVSLWDRDSASLSQVAAEIGSNAMTLVDLVIERNAYGRGEGIDTLTCQCPR
jgi:2-dehydro-3-deoxy-L-rhamnonate dehydrogenase (NAD+)